MYANEAAGLDGPLHTSSGVWEMGGAGFKPKTNIWGIFYGTILLHSPPLREDMPSRLRSTNHPS